MNKESERVMKWQRENPDKFNASKKKYLATSKAKEKHRLLQQKYRQQQKQKIIDLQSQLDIANNKLKEIKEKTEFDMKMWGKEDGFILINGNELLSIIGGNNEKEN